MINIYDINGHDINGYYINRNGINRYHKFIYPCLKLEIVEM